MKSTITFLMVISLGSTDLAHICQRIKGKNLLKELKKYLTKTDLYTQSWGYHVPASLENG